VIYINAGAAQVLACEWNPNAVEALHRNLELNGIANKCQILEGDCTVTAPQVCHVLICQAFHQWQQLGFTIEVHLQLSGTMAGDTCLM